MHPALLEEFLIRQREEEGELTVQPLPDCNPRTALCDYIGQEHVPRTLLPPLAS